jgi:hypothetical protein
MLATAVLLASVAAASQFFLAYCRSLLLMYSKIELSEYAKQMTGIDGEAPPEDAFPRIMQLLELAPHPRDDRGETFSIRLYYWILYMPELIGPQWPAVAYWVTAEREDCAHFAAVALDRRLSTRTCNVT